MAVHDATDSNQKPDDFTTISSPGTTPKINSIFDFSAEALGQLKLWLEQAGLSIRTDQIIGYKQATQATRVHLGANQSIADSTDTTVTFDTKEFDYGGLWTPTDGSRLTVRIAGKYVVQGTAIFDFNATGSRIIRLYKNAVQVSSMGVPNASVAFTTDITTSGLFDCVPGDYFTVQVRQNSGGALNILGSATDVRTSFWITRIST